MDFLLVVSVSKNQEIKEGKKTKMGIGARLGRSEKMKVKMDKLKAKGICTICRKVKVTDRFNCDKCLKKMRERMRLK